MMTGWRSAGQVLRRTFTFFGRNYPVIFAFGALASLQRFLAVGGGERFDWAGGVPGEVFTGLVRLAFVGWVCYRLLRPVMQGRVEDAVRGGVSSIVKRPWFHVASVAVLLAMIVIFKVAGDALVAAIAPPGQHQTFIAVELAIKNVTIIPFCMIWAVMTLRELCAPATDERSRPNQDHNPSTRTSRA